MKYYYSSTMYIQYLHFIHKHLLTDTHYRLHTRGLVVFKQASKTLKIVSG